MTHEELYHHGIKGMKWGVRRDKESSGLKDKFPISVLQKRIDKLDLNTSVSAITSKSKGLPKAFFISAGTAAGVSLAVIGASKLRYPLWSFLKRTGKTAGKIVGRTARKVAEDTVNSLRGR